MKRHSKDYIPYASEIEAARLEGLERVKNIPDPRHKYIATYLLYGKPVTEDILAYDMKDAEEHVRQQLSLMGWYPCDLKITAVEDTNVCIG